MATKLGPFFGLARWSEGGGRDQRKTAVTNAESIAEAKPQTIVPGGPLLCGSVPLLRAETVKHPRDGSLLRLLHV